MAHIETMRTNEFHFNFFHFFDLTSETSQKMKSFDAKIKRSLEIKRRDFFRIVRLLMVLEILEKG